MEDKDVRQSVLNALDKVIVRLSEQAEQPCNAGDLTRIAGCLISIGRFTTPKILSEPMSGLSVMSTDITDVDIDKIAQALVDKMHRAVQ